MRDRVSETLNSQPEATAVPRDGGSAISAHTPSTLDRIGLLCAVLAAVGFSFKAILVKLAYRHGWTPKPCWPCA